MGSSFPLTPPMTGPVYAFKNASIPAGNTIATTLLANPEVPFETTFTVPAGAINPGTVIDVWAAGKFSSLVNAVSITLRLKVDGNTIATFVGPIAALTANKGWVFDTMSNVLEDDTVVTRGTATMNNTVMNVNNIAPYWVNDEQNMTVSLSAQFGAVGLGNTITLEQLIVSVG